MKLFIGIIGIALLVCLFSNCKKGSSEGPRIYNLGDTVEVLEGATQIVQDTTRKVWDSTTASYKHPQYSFTYTKDLYDNRDWGLHCKFTEQTYVLAGVKLSNGAETKLDSFIYPGCTNIYCN